MRFDLHIHTMYSQDAYGTPKDAVKEAMRKKIDGICIADHNCIKGCMKGRIYSTNITNFIFIEGVEVSTDSGHVLVLGRCIDIKKNINIMDLLDLVKDEGLVAVAAHPFRLISGIGREKLLKCQFKAVEVVNGRSTKRANYKAKKIANRLIAAEIGGSDAHTLNEIGRAYTVIENAETQEDVLNAINNKKCKAEGENLGIYDTIRITVDETMHWLRRGMKRM